tara:strand:+ start:10026 stop:10802 length:777 start_codon:yes stop_codon:yes gene_type:complete
MDIQQQEYCKVLLIGDSCLDVYHYGTCERISPEAPVPILKESHTEIRGGMSLNVYNNLLSFGFDVTHVSNYEKIEKHRFIDKVSKQQMMRLDVGESEGIERLELNYILNKECDIVVISDYNKGFLTSDVIKALCTIYSDKLIFVDTKKTNLSCFSDCIIKINKHEDNAITNYGFNNQFIVTKGSEGASYKNKTYTTAEVDVYDVCGAGDVFLSALVFNYTKTLDIEDSIAFANKCASYSVTKSGTYVLTKEDIDDLCI